MAVFSVLCSRVFETPDPGQPGPANLAPECCFMLRNLELTHYSGGEWHSVRVQVPWRQTHSAFHPLSFRGYPRNSSTRSVDAFFSRPTVPQRTSKQGHWGWHQASGVVGGPASSEVAECRVTQGLPNGGLPRGRLMSGRRVLVSGSSTTPSQACTELSSSSF